MKAMTPKPPAKPGGKRKLAPSFGMPAARPIDTGIERKHAPGKMTSMKTDRGTFQMKANAPAKAAAKPRPVFGGKGGF